MRTSPRRISAGTWHVDMQAFPGRVQPAIHGMTLIEVLTVAILLGLVATATLASSRPPKGGSTRLSLQNGEWRVRDIARLHGGITIHSDRNGRRHIYRDGIQLPDAAPWPDEVRCSNDNGEDHTEIRIDHRGFSNDYQLVHRDKTHVTTRFAVNGITGQVTSRTEDTSMSLAGGR